MSFTKWHKFWFLGIIVRICSWMSEQRVGGRDTQKQCFSNLNLWSLCFRHWGWCPTASPITRGAEWRSRVCTTQASSALCRSRRRNGESIPAPARAKSTNHGELGRMGIISVVLINDFYSAGYASQCWTSTLGHYAIFMWWLQIPIYFLTYTSWSWWSFNALNMDPRS